MDIFWKRRFLSSSSSKVLNGGRQLACSQSAESDIFMDISQKFLQDSVT